MKSYLLLFFCGLLFICVISSHVVAQGLWTNAEGGFGANFPTAPTRIEGATSQVSGYGYQSIQSIDDGGALFAISAVPVSSKIGKSNSKVFLEASHATFIKMMGKKPGQSKVKWLTFGDGRNRLSYEYDFFEDDISFKGLGFWIMDKNRAIRVSVAYTNTLLTSQPIREAVSFLDSFMILSNGTTLASNNSKNYGFYPSDFGVEYKRFEHNVFGFSIDMPTSWQFGVVGQLPTAVAMLYPGDLDTSKFSAKFETICIGVMPFKGATKNAAYQQTLQGMQQGHRGLVVIMTPTEQKVGAKMGLRAIWKWPSKTGLKIIEDISFVASGDRIYSITYRAVEQAYENGKKLFEDS